MVLYSLKELGNEAVPSVDMCWIYLKFVVKSEGLHDKDKVKPMLRAFVDNASEESHTLIDNLFLLIDYFFDEFD